MLAILIANALGIFSGADVVAALGKSQTALAQVGRVLIAFLFVLCDAEIEQGSSSAFLQLPDNRNQLIP